MRSSKHTLYIDWRPSKVKVDDLYDHYARAEGVIHLGVDVEGDEIPTFIKERVSVPCSRTLGKVYASFDGNLLLLDHKVEKPSIRGGVMVHAQDKELQEIMVHALKGYNLEDTVLTSMEVEITQQSDKGDSRLATMRFEGEGENCSAFFMVTLTIKSSLHLGDYEVAGSTEYSPDGSYIEEVLDLLLRQFYPDIDF